VNVYVQFTQYLRVAYHALLGRRDTQIPRLDRLDKKSLENLSDILEPIVKDEGSKIIIQTRDSSTVEQITINYMEANAIQNTIQRRVQGMREPVTGVHTHVVMYWYQARGTPASSPIDKGVIESLSPNPVKVIFSNDAIKAALLLEDDNPFRMAYLVDVAVETVSGRPILYKVLAVHEKLERPSTTNQPDLFNQP
jgi:hypothetical protein